VRDRGLLPRGFDSLRISMQNSSDARRFIMSLTSSLVGVLLISEFGMCKSEGCEVLRVYVARSASASSQSERG